MIPTYNEADNIVPLVEEVLLVGDLLVDPQIDILIVDDNSPDGTGTVAQGLKESHRGRLEVLHRLEKLGLGSAYLTAFRYTLGGNYDFAVQMDADFSHDPSLLPRLLRAARDADLVLGSRYVPGGGVRHWPIWRQALSRLGSSYARLMLGLPLRDLTGGYKCFRRTALEALDLTSIKSDGYSFQIEVTYHCAKKGLRIVEVPIVFAERRRGQSKLSGNIMREALFLVWQLRFAGRSRVGHSQSRQRELVHMPTNRRDDAA